MSREAFNHAINKLTDAGCHVIDSNFGEESFGSWYIKVDTTPNCRIVWDRRDLMLSVEEIIGSPQTILQ